MKRDRYTKGPHLNLNFHSDNQKKNPEGIQQVIMALSIGALIIMMFFSSV